MTFEEKHDRLLKEYVNDLYNPEAGLLRTFVDWEITKRFPGEISTKLIKLSDMAAEENSKTAFKKVDGNYYKLFVHLLYKVTFENDNKG